MARVVHFEIAADDPARAVDFYQKVFGWEIRKWEGPEDYWLVTTGPKEEPGIDGGIMKRMEAISSGGPNTYVCTVVVESLDEYVDKVARNGGKIIQPRMEVMGVGWLAYCLDTEGNRFGLMGSTGMPM